MPLIPVVRSFYQADVRIYLLDKHEHQTNRIDSSFISKCYLNTYEMY